MKREEYLKKYKEWEDSMDNKYDDFPENEAQYYYSRDEIKFLKKIIDQLFDEKEKAIEELRSCGISAIEKPNEYGF